MSAGLHWSFKMSRQIWPFGWCCSDRCACGKPPGHGPCQHKRGVKHISPMLHNIVSHLWSFKWVVHGKLYVQEEDAGLVLTACNKSLQSGASSRPYHLELSSMVLRCNHRSCIQPGGGQSRLTGGGRGWWIPTHIYCLPLGPAEQFAGGSSEISASSFWMRFAADDTPAPLAFEAISAGC